MDLSVLDEENLVDDEFFYFINSLDFLSFDYHLFFDHEKDFSCSSYGFSSQGQYLYNEDYELLSCKEKTPHGLSFLGLSYLQKKDLKNLISLKCFPLQKKYTEQYPCILLDRDGVMINHVPYISNLEDVVLKDGLIDFLKLAKRKSYKLAVLTNQSGVARGYFQLDQVHKVNNKINELLKNEGIKIDAWYICPYYEKGEGDYALASLLRKPLPGMAFMAQEELGLDLKKSIMIGDNISDDLWLPYLKSIHLKGDKDLAKAKSPIFSTFQEIAQDLNF